MDVVSSQDVAMWIIKWINNLFDWLGLNLNSIIGDSIYVVVVVLFAILIGWIVRLCVLFLIKRVIMIKRFVIGKELIEQRIFTRFSHIIPPLLFLALVPFALEAKTARVLTIVVSLAKIYLLFKVGIAICALLSFLWRHYDNNKNEKNHPLRGVLNVAKGIVWIIIVIIIGSILIGKSPMVLLTGLGAFAAALMLIFKDSILGFVAGIQLSQNDMLRVGDWIIVPSTIANGIVEDVSLTVVKVRNWDNTIVMLPPYTLVSLSFQNWRGMSDVGVRLMSRTFLIDNVGVIECDYAFLEEMKNKFPLMNDIIENKTIIYNKGVAVVNGTNVTNLGLYRAYICQYLINHSMISNQWQILVNLLNSDRDGVHLQVYCYINTTDWTMYEAVQSEIMEHVISMAPKFGLSIYNTVSGREFNNLKLCH